MKIRLNNRVASALKLAQGTEMDEDKIIDALLGVIERLGQTCGQLRSQLAAGKGLSSDNDDVLDLVSQNFDDLLRNGGADKLRKLDPASYRLKYKERFGKEPARI